MYHALLNICQACKWKKNKQIKKQKIKQNKNNRNVEMKLNKNEDHPTHKLGKKGVEYLWMF